MNSKQNTNKQKGKKISKSIYTARSERSDVEIQKHFKPSIKNYHEINTGVINFPIVGDIESNGEDSVNIKKSNKQITKSISVNCPAEINFDVLLSDDLDANVEFYNSSNNDIQIDTCTSLNKKVEDINKQLADLENDIQFNFYDPKTKVGSNLKKYSSQLQSFSSSKNISNTTTSIPSEFGNFNKFPNVPKPNDPSIELKNEIYNYRSSLKQKDFEEKIEKRLEKLHKQKEQSELRKSETKGESGHESTCPLSLKIDLPEPVLKIHEMQLTAKRLKSADGSTFNNIQNAFSSQSSPPKIEQTTIQKKEPEPSTSKKNDTQTESESNLQISVTNANVGAVQQLDSLLKKSTNELDELKSLLKEYLEIEKNKSTYGDKNVKFALTGQKDKNTKKQSKPLPSCSSSNSDISLSLNFKSKKKSPKEILPRQTVNIEKKSKIIKIKETSKSTKSTKCGLSDISESDELERNSSSSDIIKNKPSPMKKQTKTIKTSYFKKGANKPNITNDQQNEIILNISNKVSSSSLLSSDEEKRIHIRDFIKKPPKDSSDLINPPNTGRLPPTEKYPNSNTVEPIKKINKKINLEVQILPSLDIKRSLTTQKLPDVAIESIVDYIDTNKMSSDNVKYIQIKHANDVDIQKEQTTEIVKVVDDSICKSNNNNITCPNECKNVTNSTIKTKTTDVKIEEIYISKQPVLSSSEASLRDDIVNEVRSTPDKKLKITPEKRGTVSEELNLDISNLPSVRTLKEIQNYLEQKCALIRSRLQEESNLKTGETLSLRYKLFEPPVWKSTQTEAEDKNLSEQKSKSITLSHLKSYSSLKSPLSPLQKQDKSQQVKHNASLIYKPKTVKTIDKSLQVSITENIELPVARTENICSPQISIQTSNKDINEIKDSFKTPPLTSLNTEKSNEIQEETVSTQTDNFKVICLPYNIRKIDVALNTNNTNVLNEKNNTLENQVTNNIVTAENKFSDISTQINEFDYVKDSAKHVSFGIVTKQFSFIPNENKETQILQSDLVGEMTKKTPIEANNKEKVEKKQYFKNENTQIITVTNKEKPKLCYLQSNATTQTVNVKNKNITCNLENNNEKGEVQQKVPSDIKDTKECCTQYSPIEEPLDATEYKNIKSFDKDVNSENEELCKHVHYQPEERQCYYKSKIKNKRAPQRYKICSTPISSSSISTIETVSLSDGEVKLTCECSTSIGEIHLCHFANDIRKKVRILKQNPEKILKESLGGVNFKMKRQHKYNDNWLAYYVTKTESSSEHGTDSNLSSIKSNIETE